MMDILSVVLDVLLFGFMVFSFCMYCDIVHVDRQPTLCYFRVEDSVHHHLEGGGRVGKAKEHYGGFE